MLVAVAEISLYTAVVLYALLQLDALLSRFFACCGSGSLLLASVQFSEKTTFDDVSMGFLANDIYVASFGCSA